MDKEKLYKLIIADDEDTIRNGLVNLNIWDDLGFEIIAAYEDGLGIIKYLDKSQDVDVLLSDIVMNEYSGLDVLKYINKNNIDVKTIFLSGYSDFKIAQEAISLGASAYLLKPTAISKIRETFIKVKKELDEQRTIRESNEAEKLWLEKFLLSITCTPSHINIDKLWNIIGIKSSHKYFYWTSVFIEINQEYNGNTNEIELILKSSLDFEKEWIVVTNALIGSITILILIPKDLPMTFYENLVCEKMVRTVETLTDLFNYDMKLRDVIITDNWREMQIAVNNPGIEKQNIITVNSIYSSDSLFDYIKNRDYEKLKNFLQYATEHKNEVHPLIIRVSMMLYLQLIHYYIDLNRESQIEDIKKVIYQDQNTEMVIQYCYDAICALEKLLGKRKKIVSMMYEYISLHIGEGLTLYDMAKHFNYNASYLSRVFKEATGESFSSTLKKIKIKQAKAMLNNPKLKIYEISEKLGYQDVRHFYKVFKDVTKMTPSKYRESREID